MIKVKGLIDNDVYSNSFLEMVKEFDKSIYDYIVVFTPEIYERHRGAAGLPEQSKGIKRIWQAFSFVYFLQDTGRERRELHAIADEFDRQFGGCNVFSDCMRTGV